MDKSIKILIVDDFATMRKVIRNLLKQSGYENIVEAEDGVNALKILKSQKIDFIVSDWNMPNKNGLELTRDIRAINADVPIFMVTTEAEKGRVLEAIQAGVTDYLVKPFSADSLREKLDKFATV